MPSGLTENLFSGDSETAFPFLSPTKMFAKQESPVNGILLKSNVRVMLIMSTDGEAL